MESAPGFQHLSSTSYRERQVQLRFNPRHSCLTIRTLDGTHLTETHQIICSDAELDLLAVIHVEPHDAASANPNLHRRDSRETQSRELEKFQERRKIELNKCPPGRRAQRYMEVAAVVEDSRKARK